MISKFRILENNEIDKVKWDEVVSNSEFSNYSGLSYFLDAIYPNWKGVIYEDYQYVFPLTIGSKFNIDFLITPIFIPYVGVSSYKKDYSNIIPSLLEAINKQTKYIDLYIDPYTSRFLDGETNSIRKGQVLNLDKSHLEIQSDYSKNHKRNIKKGNNNKLNIKTSIDVKRFISLFKSNKGEQLKELKELNYFTLIQALEKSIENKTGFLLDCYDRNNLICSAFFIVFNNRVTYIKGFSSSEGRAKGAMHFLIDHVISIYSKSEIIFDFGGSNSLPVAQFNYGFGAKDIFYQNYKINNLPYLLKLFKP